MNHYETLTGRRIDLKKVSAKERRIFALLMAEYVKGADWEVFSDQWQAAVAPILAHVEKEERVQCPVYLIGQDMEMRLGIAQGKVAPPDYRDFIVDRIRDKFGSRYRFCKETGIPEAFLSQVLSGKKDFSLETLRRVATALDLAIAVLPTADLANMPMNDLAVYTRACSLVKEEIATLKKVLHSLKYQKDAVRRMTAYAKERQLFETALGGIDARLKEVPETKRGEAILRVLEDEVEKLEATLASLRERLAGIAEPDRRGGASVGRAQMSRV